MQAGVWNACDFPLWDCLANGESVPTKLCCHEYCNSSLLVRCTWSNFTIGDAYYFQGGFISYS